MRKVNLPDVCIIENRPQKNVVYKKHTILIQVSATKGQVLLLNNDKEVESKYALLTAKQGVNPVYLFLVIELFFPSFFKRYKQGLNLNPEDLKHFSFLIHEDSEIQKQIADTFLALGITDVY